MPKENNQFVYELIDSIHLVIIDTINSHFVVKGMCYVLDDMCVQGRMVPKSMTINLRTEEYVFFSCLK